MTRRQAAAIGAGTAVVAIAVVVAVVVGGGDDGGDDDGDGPTAITGLPFSVADGEAVAYDRAFVPEEVHVDGGVRVVLRNRDDQDHTFTADEGLFDSGVVAPDGTFEASFEGPQRIAYHCDIHPTMHGVIVVD